MCVVMWSAHLFGVTGVTWSQDDGPALLTGSSLGHETSPGR